MPDKNCDNCRKFNDCRTGNGTWPCHNNSAWEGIGNPQVGSEAVSTGLTSSKAPVWGAQIMNDGEIVILYPAMNFADNVMQQNRRAIGIDNAEKLLKELENCLP